MMCLHLSPMCACPQIVSKSCTLRAFIHRSLRIDATIVALHATRQLSFTAYSQSLGILLLQRTDVGEESVNTGEGIAAKLPGGRPRLSEAGVKWYVQTLNLAISPRFHYLFQKLDSSLTTIGQSLAFCFNLKFFAISPVQASTRELLHHIHLSVGRYPGEIWSLFVVSWFMATCALKYCSRSARDSVPGTSCLR